jgi:hypothetical protein
MRAAGAGLPGESVAGALGVVHGRLSRSMGIQATCLVSVGRGRSWPPVG